MHDHAAVLLQQVKLVVVKPDAVHKLHIRPQRAQRRQPFDMAQPSQFQVHLHFFARLGDVDHRADAPRLALRVSAAHRLVRTAPGNQRRKLDADAAVGAPVPGCVQPLHLRHDLVGRLHEGRVIPHVCPATRQQEAHARLLRRAANAIVVARLGVDILVVDHCRGAAANVFDQPEFGGDVGFLLGERLGDGPDRCSQPFQQRLIVRQPAQEGLKQVRVRIDHARHDRHVRGVDAFTGGSAQRLRRCTRADGCDLVILDVDIARLVQRAGIINGQHCTVFDQDRTSHGSPILTKLDKT